MQKLPLGQGSAEKVVMKYPSEGGSSPGDTRDLYVGAGGRIQEITFHRGGTAKPGLVIASWADHKRRARCSFPWITRERLTASHCTFRSRTSRSS
jgi:hypothetical protein